MSDLAALIPLIVSLSALAFWVVCRYQGGKVKELETLLGKVELSLSISPADQPNCPMCDRTVKIIEDFREERGEYD